MTQQTFDTIDIARLQIEDDWPALPNLIRNPTGIYGVWGWRQRALGVTWAAVAGPAIRFTRGTFSATCDSDYIEVVPGAYVRALLDRVGGTSGIGFTGRFMFYAADKATLISSSAQTAAQTTNGTLDVAATVVPAGTKYVNLRITHTGTTSGHFVDFTNACLVSGTVGEVAVTPTVEPSWVDLLSPATEIGITREELNLGILTAVVRDSALDPSQTDVIRKGKQVRLTALDAVSGLWEVVFAGWTREADVTYDLLHHNPIKRPRITLQAVDPSGVLASTPRPNSVDTIANLPDVLDNVGVPWNVNGSVSPIFPVPAVAVSENASALDQVAMTRDTARGYAWVSRKGVLNAWDRTSITGTVVTTLDEDDYTDLQLGYNTNDLLNSVSVIVRTLEYTSVGNAETVERRYGPYVDEISARERGKYHADFTVTANWTEANAATYAAAVLATNPYPRVRVNSVRLPVKDAAHIVPSRALLDLYDKVTVNNTASGIAQDLRITRIVHTITPKKWVMDLGFAEVGNVATPQIVPPAAPVSGDTAGVWTAYTPTATGGVNGFTSYTSAGRFRVIDHKTVAFKAEVIVTNAGASNLESIVIGLPFSHVNGGACIVVGRENAVLGTMLQGIINGGANILVGLTYNNQGITATGHTYIFSGVYERQ